MFTALKHKRTHTLPFFFRHQDLRGRVYGILLDAKTKKPEDCVVNEWFASEENPEVEKPRPVAVKPLDPTLDIPSLESLWFGAEPEDGQRRLRAFLACMKVNEEEERGVCG